MNFNRNISAFLIITLVLITNILFNLFDLNFDLTKDKRYTISKKSISLIEELDDRLFIKVYLEGDLPAEFKKLQIAIESILKNFRSLSNDDIDFEFINPNKNNNEKLKIDLFKQLVKQGLIPTDLDMSKFDRKINQIIFPGAILYYKDKYLAINFLKQKKGVSTFSNINNSIENLEFSFISTIQQLKKNKLKKIAFLDGNGELSEEQVYDINNSVTKDNFKLSYYYDVDRFNIKEFSIDSTTMEPNLQEKMNMLNLYKAIIIAKPTIPFNNLDKFLIDQYIMKGGRVLWLIDGVKADINSLNNDTGSFIARKNKLNISDQLRSYGVIINSDLIQDLRSTKIPIITGYSNNSPQQSFFKWQYFPLLKSTNQHTITKGLDALITKFPSSLDTINNKIEKTILLHSSKKSRINNTPAKISLGIIENPPEIDSYNKQFLPISILLEGKFKSIFKDKLIKKSDQIDFLEQSKANKMIIVSDGDIICNDVSSSGNIYPLGYDRNIQLTYDGNKLFIINAIQYLCDDISYSDLKQKKLIFNTLDKVKIKKNKLLIQLINIILPIILILIFAFCFFKNKNRKYA